MGPSQIVIRQSPGLPCMNAAATPHSAQPTPRIQPSVPMTVAPNRMAATHKRPHSLTLSVARRVRVCNNRTGRGPDLRPYAPKLGRKKDTFYSSRKQNVPSLLRRVPLLACPAVLMTAGGLHYRLSMSNHSLGRPSMLGNAGSTGNTGGDRRAVCFGRTHGEPQGASRGFWAGRRNPPSPAASALPLTRDCARLGPLLRS